MGLPFAVDRRMLIPGRRRRRWWSGPWPCSTARSRARRNGRAEGHPCGWSTWAPDRGPSPSPSPPGAPRRRGPARGGRRPLRGGAAGGAGQRAAPAWAGPAGPGRRWTSCRATCSAPCGAPSTSSWPTCRTSPAGDLATAACAGGRLRAPAGPGRRDETGWPSTGPCWRTLRAEAGAGAGVLLECDPRQADALGALLRAALPGARGAGLHGGPGGAGAGGRGRAPEGPAAHATLPMKRSRTSGSWSIGSRAITESSAARTVASVRADRLPPAHDQGHGGPGWELAGRRWSCPRPGLGAGDDELHQLDPGLAQGHQVHGGVGGELLLDQGRASCWWG